MANTNASGVNYLADSNPSGTSVTKNATDKLSFYGGTPVVQAAYTGNFANGSDGLSMSVKLDRIVSILQNMGLCAAS